MLGEEHYIVLLSSSSAIFQWHSRANGWHGGMLKTTAESGGHMRVDLQVI